MEHLNKERLQDEIKTMSNEVGDIENEINLARTHAFKYTMFASRLRKLKKTTSKRLKALSFIYYCRTGSFLDE